MVVQLDADAAFILKAWREAARPALDTVSPAEARALFLEGSQRTEGEAPPIASSEDIVVPIRPFPLRSRIYRPLEPRGEPGRSPALVFFHGGGWVVGDLQSHDVACRTLAHDGRLTVIAVDYRLAPEHPFPAAVDDAIAATAWVVREAATLGLDPQRISVGGDSAGGNLAAVVALAARDGGFARLQGQVLIYPATDATLSFPSHADPATDLLLSHSLVRWFHRQYLGDGSDSADWRASPLRARSHADLPPAYVLTAGGDPLCDEGQAYARRLTEAGVRVTTRNFPGQFHGFITMGRVLPQAGVALGEIGAWLRDLQ